MLNKFLSFSISVSLVAGSLLLFQIRAVHAYIDPGTGSFLLQMLLATGLASLFMIKVYWKRLTGQVSRLFAKFRITDVKSD